LPIYKVDGVKKDGLQKYLVRVNYTADCGKAKQLTRTAYGSDEAKALERKLDEQIKNKELWSAKKLTVQQLHDEYVNVKQHEQRQTSLDKFKRNMKNFILPTFKDIRIDRITVQMMKDWKLAVEGRTYLKKGTPTKLALRTKKSVYTSFRALLNYAIEMEYLPRGENPVTKVKCFKDTESLPSKMDYYTAEEFKLFIQAAKEIAIEREKQTGDISEWEYYVFFNIAFYMGIRKGENHALKFTDIICNVMEITRSITQRLKGGDKETPPKNKSSIRALQMPLPLIQVIDEHIGRLKKAGIYNENNRICGGVRSLRNSTVQRRNELYAKTAGLKLIRIHDFRHSHVSVLANERINIQEIARRLGHSRIEMTWNTYSHLYPREEERAVDILNAIAA